MEKFFNVSTFPLPALNNKAFSSMFLYFAAIANNFKLKI
jgi:hypothetical protein